MNSSSLVLCLLNEFLSFITIILNIVTIHAIRKTSSLSKNFRTLLLSLAASDLGVGLLSQPMFVTSLIMESKQNNGSSKAFDAIRIAFLTPKNIFSFATLFLIIVLCAERFAARTCDTQTRCCCSCLNLGIQCTHFMRLWFPKNIMYVVFGIIHSACIIAATFFSARIYFSVQRHLKELQVLQSQQARKNGQMANIKRLRRFSIIAWFCWFAICQTFALYLFLPSALLDLTVL